MNREGTSVLTVSNTGPVVPPVEIDRLLQPFQRLANERNAGDDGLGLGLSIVHAIAIAHGAALAARARTDGGLAVEVSFPTAASPTPGAEPESPQLAGENRRRRIAPPSGA
jgi:signal transduction histidine kinase